jgi:hypothetical protein
MLFALAAPLLEIVNPLVPGQLGAYLQNGDGVISRKGERVSVALNVPIVAAIFCGSSIRKLNITVIPTIEAIIKFLRFSTLSRSFFRDGLRFGI